MRKLFFIASALIIFAGTVSILRGNEGEVEVLWPPDKTYFYTDRVTLVLKLIGRMDRLLVRKGDTVLMDKAVELRGQEGNPPSSSPFCLNLELKEGENKITIAGLSAGRELTKKELSLFFATKYVALYVLPPKDYKIAYFHSSEVKKLCISCHPSLNKALVKVTSLKDSTCLFCHRSKVSGPFVHGPVAVGDCGVCHLLTEDEKSFVAEKPIKRICARCHEEAISGWEKKKYWHGPTATGDCLICHEVHAAPEAFFLRKKTNTLCLGCHEEKASGRHVIASYVFGNTHPVLGNSNPLRPDRPFNCASCHSPHAASSQELFVLDIDQGRLGLCQACHKK